MRDDVTPALGLAVPIVTILDDDARLVEADQRAVVAHVLQAGRGAGIVFVMGTTGEWNRVDAATRRAVIEVSIDAVARANAERTNQPAARVWVGVTAPRADETLESIELAARLGADAIVLAPLAIDGLADPLGFVCDSVAGRLRAHPDLPLYLYDNAEIAARPERPLLDANALRRLAALDCVRGIKISAPRQQLEDAMRSLEAGRGSRPGLDVYVGHASMIFDMVRTTGALRAGLGRSGRAARLAGLVPGAANVLPREWRLAWEACWRGDRAAVDATERAVDAYRRVSFVGERRPIIASLKRALLVDGIVESAAVAPGTDPLSETEARAVDAAHAAARASALRALGDARVTLSCPGPA